MPNTVPNSATDVATFASSAVHHVSIMGVEDILGSLVFNPGADSFSFKITSHQSFGSLSLGGEGIVNNSGKPQQFILGGGAGINFDNSASAGDGTTFSLVNGGYVNFGYDNPTAGTAHFMVGGGGNIFFSHGTAASATFDIEPDGVVTFISGTAENATFTVNGGILEFDLSATAAESVIDCSEDGVVKFETIGLLGSPQVTAHGATSSGQPSGHIIVIDGAGADHATFVVEGGTSERARGASLGVWTYSDLQNAQVTLTGGTSGGDGGSLFFSNKSTGGSASITMSGNATLDMSGHDPDSPVTVGSLDGEGTVFLGASQLSVGNNNLSTTFSGVIQDTGSLIKLGRGTLTLTGANTYTGSTTVTGGALRASNSTGSATGAGALSVQAGTLGGTGIVAGPATIGTGSGQGSFLQPGKGVSAPTTLTFQNTLILQSDSTYIWKLNTEKAKGDQVLASGVMIQAGAQFTFNTVGDNTLTTGTVFTAISNTAATSISGTFANLADGSTVTIGVNKLQVSYSGGDGNDLTLTVVP